MQKIALSQALDYNPERLILLDLRPFGVPNSRIYIYLDYLNHSLLSGNKLRKLYGSIIQPEFENSDTFITIGGNFSNYLYACSFLPQLFGKKLVAIVKGYEPNDFGFTLSVLKNSGAEIIFYPKEYLKQNLDDIIQTLKQAYPRSVFVPEGGYNQYSHIGFEYLTQNHLNRFDKIVVPVGTSSTYKGIEFYLSDATKLLGYAAHKDYSLNSIGQINFNYAMGGFAKMTDELFDFIEGFYTHYQIPLDPVYTSKMMYGLIQDIKNKTLDASQSFICLHTGGLQGWAGQKIKPSFYSQLGLY